MRSHALAYVVSLYKNQVNYEFIDLLNHKGYCNRFFIIKLL